MKIAVLSAFPLVDRHRYKHAILDGLAARSQSVQDVALVYGYSGLRPLVGVARRTYSLKGGLRRVRNAAGDASEEASPGGPVGDRARDHGFTVARFDRYQDPACVDFLRSFGTDVAVNLSGMYVPRVILHLPTFGVVGGHYATLPEIRGADTIRWAVLRDRPVAVSHQLLAEEYDMGDVVRREPVRVRRGDSIDDIRASCQAVHAAGCLAVVDELATGTLSREPQEPGAGSYFRPMGSRLCAKVDRLLGEQRYSHYDEDTFA